MLPDWIWGIFVFVVGACVGSFLNVVIYRLPRDESLILPPSACPKCGARIHPLDNLPLLSWLVLRGKCRHCGAGISPRYFVIELLTGVLFLSVFLVFFESHLREALTFLNGGWFIYLVTIILVSVLVAVSAIDLELWIIPLSLCWFLTAVGVIASVLSIYIIGIEDVSGYELMPVASAGQAALAAGAVPGLVISLVLLKTGIIKRSYEADYAAHDIPDKPGGESEGQAEEADNYNHRLEVLKEVVFLLPIIICAYVAFEITGPGSALRDVWIDFSQYPAMAGLFGSLFGYFVGCGVVWGTRILGTLAFGKEAMGLGDVHIMGAAGAVIGWKFIIVAFLIAPFFGLAWAAVQMFFRKTREIPYGPFLSLGIFAVIILHDRILNYLNFMLYHQPGQ